MTRHHCSFLHQYRRMAYSGLAVVFAIVVIIWAFTPVQAADLKTNTTWLSLAELLKKWQGIPMKQVEQDAKEGNPMAQHYLGYCYMEGFRLAQNVEAGKIWYQRALTNGYLPSANNLGFAYQRGLLGSNDLKRAIAYYTYAARRGLAQSQFNLGVLYRDGIGVQRNAKEALKWFRQAAKEGQLTAMVEIGRAYRFGRGVHTNLVEAEKWFQKAANNGSTLAQLNLGLLYEEEGWQEAAFQFYKRAAHQGQTGAMTKLYCCYWDGVGVPPNHTKAMYWLTKAATAGNPWAEYLMGDRCEYPDYPDNSSQPLPTPNLVEACHWYRRSAKQGWAEGEYHLGLFYLEGRVVNRSEVRGLKLVRAAADQGLDEALVKLADLYAQGIGVPRSEKDRPMQLLQRAHDYERLIFRYQYGVGTQHDLVAAAQWYCRAALAGYGSIVDKIEYHPSKDPEGIGETWGVDRHVPIYGPDLPPDGLSDELRRVLSLVLKSALGNGQAALHIGNMYLAGQDAPKTPVKAWLWFTVAAQNGSAGAQAELAKAEANMTAAQLKQARRELPGLVKELGRVASYLREFSDGTQAK